MQQDPPFATRVTAHNFGEELEFASSKWPFKFAPKRKPFTVREWKKYKAQRVKPPRRKPKAFVNVEFKPLFKKLITIFFEQREVTTVDFFAVLIKQFKREEELAGQKYYEVGDGRIYKRAQEMIKILRLLGVLSHQGKNGDQQVQIINVSLALNEGDLRQALKKNRSYRMEDKIKIVYRLYLEAHAAYFGGQETEDEDPAVDVDPQPQDGGK